MNKQTHRLTLLLALVATTMFLGLSTAIAQDDDPIEMVRKTPPHLLRNSGVAESQIKWRLKQLAHLRGIEMAQYHEAADAQKKLQRKSQTLIESLPIEVRFAGEEVRSSLIGECLREMFQARLEIASQEFVMAELTRSLDIEKNKKDSTDQLQRHKQHLRIEMLEHKVELCSKEFEQATALHKKSYTSDSEVQRAEYQVRVAKLELEQAMIEFQVEESSRENEIAEELIRTRFAMQPFKARVQASQKFLELLSSSSKAMKIISEIDRELELHREKQKDTLHRVWTIDAEMNELQSLLALTNSARKETKKESKSDKE